MSDKESTVQEPSLLTPGQLLKEARIEKGLSLEQVANKINLRAHNIEAIEQDRDDSNLSMTFTRGYLKLYAKFVDVKEADVLEAFERMNSVTKEPAKLQSFSRRVAKQTSDARLMMLTYFIIAIVIALSVVWWLQQADESPVVQTSNSISTQTGTQDNAPIVTQRQANTSPEPSTEITNALPVVVVPSETLDNDNVAELANDEITSQVENTIDDLNNTIEQVTNDSDVEADDGLLDAANEVQETVDVISDTDNIDNTAAPIELVFEFAEDCWMNLIDATGEAIAYGVKTSGRVMTVSGVPPFEVTLGAPQVVQISVGGEPVDMSVFPAGRTAKFELPVQE